MIVPINNGRFNTYVYIPTYTTTNFSSNDTTTENESRTDEYHEATPVEIGILIICIVLLFICFVNLIKALKEMLDEIDDRNQ